MGGKCNHPLRNSCCDSRSEGNTERTRRATKAQCWLSKEVCGRAPEITRITRIDGTRGLFAAAVNLREEHRYGGAGVLKIQGE